MPWSTTCIRASGFRGVFAEPESAAVVEQMLQSRGITGIDCISSRVGNRVVIDLPDPQSAPQLYTASKALEVLRTLIDVFAPDSAVWTNHSVIAPQKEPNEPLVNGGYRLGHLVGIPAGWANYLRDNTLAPFSEAELPTDTHVERLGNGSLVYVGDNPADPALDKVLQIRRAMGYRIPEVNTSPSGGEPSSASAASGLATAGPTVRSADTNPQQDADFSHEKPDIQR